MNLIDKKPSRLFTFGCSFTSYFWSMWPEIIALDLDIPLYNFGKCGAGNQYIANTIAQANAHYKFTSSDLVVVCWTNVIREDRWFDNWWQTPGNIYSQDTYPKWWVKKYVDPVGCLARDLASIHSSRQLLENSSAQFHFLAMLDIVGNIDQYDPSSIFGNTPEYRKLTALYADDINLIQGSFYSVLWNDDLNNKQASEHIHFGNKFSDCHPFADESYKYLRNVFNEHSWRDSTAQAAADSAKQTRAAILDYASTVNKRISVYDLPRDQFDIIFWKNSVYEQQQLSDALLI